MAQAVNRNTAEIDYVNQPGSSTNSLPELETRGNRAESGTRLLRLVAVGVGVLCILQVALNVSLRLALYKPQPAPDEVICVNKTEDVCKLKQETRQYLQKGWLYFRDSFYFISSVQKTWAESRTDCQQEDADLVIINSREEQIFITQLARDRLTWIGLQEVAGTEQWIWVNEVPLTDSYWGPGEPNKLAKEVCVEMRFFENENSWNDMPCSTENFWICEKETIVTEEDSCFLVLCKKSSLLPVVSRRRSEGKMPGVVRREPAEFSMDYVNLPEPAVTTAAGGVDQGNRPAPGTKLLRLVGVSFGLLCLLQAAVNVSLRLTLFKPDGQTSTTCRNETDKKSQLIERYIQQGWVRFQSSVYYISFARSTWLRSRQFCRRQGADLVIINTKEEQDFTRQFNRLTWLGLHNDTKTRKWTWVDGTELTKNYWGPEEPNGFEGKIENCVEIRFFELENSWNDIPCEDQNYWICEKNVAP
ncbi:uncharacterized protein LOC129367161 [Poeciliopsis prolifica]|uniref:uncharacterized protein LOC129367161 n=1 Tax=Poeciliopsis prolifica TaxID=188132 RepID=UPI0024133BDA|nr:uncharacterized protein LOC129367161 [Poeciliopsis prolifica]